MILDLEEILTAEKIKLLRDFEGFYVEMDTQIIDKLCKMSIDEIKEVICALKKIICTIKETKEDYEGWLTNKSVKELILDYAESILEYMMYCEKDEESDVEEE